MSSCTRKPGRPGRSAKRRKAARSDGVMEWWSTGVTKRWQKLCCRTPILQYSSTPRLYLKESDHCLGKGEPNARTSNTRGSQDALRRIEPGGSETERTYRASADGRVAAI